MIDLNNQTDISRLYDAIESSRTALRPFRVNRIKMLEEYVGSYYGESGSERSKVIVNLLSLTAEAYTIGLAAQNPKCVVNTQHRELWPFAYKWQYALNNFMEGIRYYDILQQVVLDAFFSIGIAKIYQADWKSIQLEDDVYADPGRPHISRVSIDDFVMDMNAKDIRLCKFMLDEYRVPWSKVKGNPAFDQDVVAQMTPTSKWDREDATANQITAGMITDDDEMEPMVTLMDVWLPELDTVAIMARSSHLPPLATVDSSSRGGPYELLTFGDVPDNTMPLAPGQNLLGLHLLYNRLARKQARQAMRQKTNPVFRPSAKNDADRLRKYGDGEWVKSEDPKGIAVVNQGGVDAGNAQFGMAVHDLYKEMAGNLDTMAGLGPTAGTVGQEQIIAQAVSRKEAKMHSRTHKFTANALGKIGYLMWEDVVLEVPGTTEYAPGVYRDVSWTPDQRSGEFWMYNFDIKPHSMDYEPPQAKIEKIERAMAQLERVWPMIEAAGGQIDVQELVKQLANKLDVPELENIVVFPTNPAIERPGPAGERPKLPSTTTRRNVRINVPTGGTQQSRSSIMQQALLDGSGQATPQQMATL